MVGYGGCALFGRRQIIDRVGRDNRVVTMVGHSPKVPMMRLSYLLTFFSVTFPIDQFTSFSAVIEYFMSCVTGWAGLCLKTFENPQ